MKYRSVNAFCPTCKLSLFDYTKEKNKLLKFPLRLYHYVERIMDYPLTEARMHVCMLKQHDILLVHYRALPQSH